MKFDSFTPRPEQAISSAHIFSKSKVWHGKYLKKQQCFLINLFWCQGQLKRIICFTSPPACRKAPALIWMVTQNKLQGVSLLRLFHSCTLFAQWIQPNNTPVNRLSTFGHYFVSSRLGVWLHSSNDQHAKLKLIKYCVPCTGHISTLF
jgi:hypothetical protein